MKLTRYIGAFLFSALASAGLNAQRPKADDLLQQVLETLKTNDGQAYLALLPKQELSDRVAGSQVPVQATSEAKKEGSANDKQGQANADKAAGAEATRAADPDAASKRIKNTLSGFQGLRLMGEKKGLRWEQAEMVSFTLDSSAKDFAAAAGVKTLKGVMDVRFGEMVYQISFDQLLNAPSEGGWFAPRLKEIIRKGEEGFAEEKGTKGVDVSTMPPAKAKTKVKATGTKTKTKAKS